jgi:hypothetical protein
MSADFLQQQFAAMADDKKSKKSDKAAQKVSRAAIYCCAHHTSIRAIGWVGFLLGGRSVGGWLFDSPPLSRYFNQQKEKDAKRKGSTPVANVPTAKGTIFGVSLEECIERFGGPIPPVIRGPVEYLQANCMFYFLHHVFGLALWIGVKSHVILYNQCRLMPYHHRDRYCYNNSIKRTRIVPYFRHCFTYHTTRRNVL